MIALSRSEKEFKTIARGSITGTFFVENETIWQQLKTTYYDN
jgi:hypothetical protein